MGGEDETWRKGRRMGPGGRATVFGDAGAGGPDLLACRRKSTSTAAHIKPEAKTFDSAGRQGDGVWRRLGRAPGFGGASSKIDTTAAPPRAAAG